MKSVAFVIITLGTSQYLEPMLSFLSNSYRVIVVDNSVDRRCLQLNRRYNIQYIHEKRQGASYARNTGASFVKNEDYIYFLDDDLSLTEEWASELLNVLKSPCLYDVVGGKVIAEYSLKTQIPRKYIYLVGGKDLGNTSFRLKHDYLGGCNLLVRRTTFSKLGGFDTDYGHKGTAIGLNEDVNFQEKIRRTNGLIQYNPKLLFIHHWKGSISDIEHRVQLQGIYDRKTDLSYNRFRFIMRMIKYTLWLFSFTYSKNDDLDDEKHYDYLRYSAYVRNSAKKQN